MLKIRLSRIGQKNKPMYRLIISEKTKDPYGRALEILGSYNPHTKDLQAKADRITHWISQGAGMSATVNNLLIEKNIIKGEKVKASKPGKKTEGATENTEGNTEKKTENADAPKKEASKENDSAEEKPAEDTTKQNVEDKKE